MKPPLIVACLGLCICVMAGSRIVGCKAIGDPEYKRLLEERDARERQAAEQRKEDLIAGIPAGKKLAEKEKLGQPKRPFRVGDPVAEGVILECNIDKFFVVRHRLYSLNSYRISEAVIYPDRPQGEFREATFLKDELGFAWDMLGGSYPSGKSWREYKVYRDAGKD